MIDTTEKYIKMCEKAIVIQRYWIPMEGDFITTSNGIIVLSTNIMGFHWHECHLHEIRIPVCKPIEITFERNKLSDTINFKYAEFNIKQIHNPIWLPRQDQLQDMVELTGYKENDKTVDLWILGDFTEFTGNNWKTFVTMEQLWLAFVMHKKYGKVWDDEQGNWVKK